MPGETYQSFQTGINDLLDGGAHNSLWIYRCTLLPNAPMNYTEYRKKHKIKTIRTPIELNHTVPGSDPVQEYEDTVCETATMPKEDVIKTLLLSWSVQAFHALGLLQVFAVFAKKLHNINYTTFYESILEYAELNPTTILGKEYAYTKEKIYGAITKGDSWENIVSEYNQQTWSFEEGTFLRIMLKLKNFYSEANDFLEFFQKKSGFEFDKALLSDILLSLIHI